MASLGNLVLPVFRVELVPRGQLVQLGLRVLLVELVPLDQLEQQGSRVHLVNRDKQVCISIHERLELLGRVLISNV